MTRLSLLTALFATLLATSTDAQAARKKRPVEKAPEKSITVGVSAGYAMPKGNFDANTDFSDTVKSQIPLALDIGYKITPRFTAGVYYSYGLVSLSETITATVDESSDISAHTSNYGIQGQLFFLDEGDRPWVGFSVGKEALNIDDSGSGIGFHGTDNTLPLLGFSAGYEVSAGDFKVSPFLSVHHGTFTSSELAMTTSSSTFTTSDELSDNESASHQWLTIGVRGYIDVL